MEAQADQPRYAGGRAPGEAAEAATKLLSPHHRSAAGLPHTGPPPGSPDGEAPSSDHRNTTGREVKFNKVKNKYIYVSIIPQIISDNYAGYSLIQRTDINGITNPFKTTTLPLMSMSLIKSHALQSNTAQTCKASFLILLESSEFWANVYNIQ